MKTEFSHSIDRMAGGNVHHKGSVTVKVNFESEGFYLGLDGHEVTASCLASFVRGLSRSGVGNCHIFVTAWQEDPCTNAPIVYEIIGREIGIQMVAEQARAIAERTDATDKT